MFLLITTRFFNNSDAEEVAALVAKTMRAVNIKDYSSEYIENFIQHTNKGFFIEKAKFTHLYIFLDGTKIVGTGAIGPYWGSETESSLFDIFVLPEYEGQGIGRQIIQTLERDAYFLKASRVEIPASITAVGFYQKMGYTFKDGTDTPDEEQLYHLEKRK